MSKIKKIEKVIKHVAKKEQLIASELAGLRRQMQQEQDQLSQLKNYQQDYQQTFAAKYHHTNVADTLTQFQAFVQQLEQLVGQQHNKVDKLAQNIEQLTLEWKAQYQRKKMLETLKEKYQQNQQALENKLEQKLLDELTTRRRKV